MSGLEQSSSSDLVAGAEAFLVEQHEAYEQAQVAARVQEQSRERGFLRRVAGGVLHFAREAFPAAPVSQVNLPPISSLPNNWGHTHR